MEQKRISELDIFRGICICGVAAAHFYYDLTVFEGIPWKIPTFFTLLFRYGGILFVLLSGVCATLGTRTVKRGAIVFGCGMLVTAVSMAADRILGTQEISVFFGVLHLLGVCMLLYPLLKKLPTAALPFLAAAILGLGYYFDTLRVSVSWLFPIGLVTHAFFSADYWPLFPHLGYFLLGIFAGRTLYREKTPRIPALQGKCRFLAFCGRQSLLIYLLMQPILFGLTALLSLLLT